MQSFHKKEYDNGIILVYHQIENPYFFYFTQYYNVGSKDFSIGLLHFFEHCAFSSPEDTSVPTYAKFLREYNISKYATTSKENLEFHYAGLQEYWKKIVDSFFECFNNKKITQEVFDNEKKRIFHEIEEEDANDNVITHENFSLTYRDKETIAQALGDKENLERYVLGDLQEVMKKVSDHPFTLYLQSSLSFELIIDYIDEKLSKIAIEGENIQKKVRYAQGGESEISLSQPEKNHLIQYSFLYPKKYNIREQLYTNIIEEYFSFDGASLLSEKLRFEIGVYGYSISKLFYQHGIMLFFSFQINSIHADDFKKNLKKLLHIKMEIPEKEFSVLKRKLKFDYLQNLSDPFEVYESGRERYQIFGDIIFGINIIEELQKITLEDVQNFHKKMIEDSIQSCVVGIKK